jgi:hypothetical protein
MERQWRQFQFFDKAELKIPGVPADEPGPVGY